MNEGGKFKPGLVVVSLIVVSLVVLIPFCLCVIGAVIALVK